MDYMDAIASGGIHGEDAWYPSATWYPKDILDKCSTIETHWLPSVNRLGTYGRWAFLELTDPFAMEKQFGDWIEARVQG
jgi:hypothetical protein